MSRMRATSRSAGLKRGRPLSMVASTGCRREPLTAMSTGDGVQDAHVSVSERTSSCPAKRGLDDGFTGFDDAARHGHLSGADALRGP